MTTVVLDSSAVVTWILQEPGWPAIDALFRRDDVDLVLPGPALTEVIDVARRRGNRSSAQQLADAVRAQRVRIEASTVADLVRAAERAELGRRQAADRAEGTGPPGTLSLGDTLILAAAGRLGAPVVTRDRFWTWLRERGVLDVDVVQF